MELRIKIENEPEVEKKIKMNMDRLGNVVRESMREAAEQLATEIELRGVQDIESAGNFGESWTDAWHADITETQRTVRLQAGMEPGGPPVTFWPVFQHGANIFAHNPTGLLTWPNKSLFSIDGKVPAFISKPSVQIPKLFHLTEIVKEEAAKALTLFKEILKANRGA
jgi:hypothetical protein